MVAVTIISLLTGLAVPSFQRIILSNRVAGAANLLITAIHQGRSEALKRNTIVRLCALDGNETETTCAAPDTTDWSNGWIVFLDPDADGQPTAAGDVLTQHRETKPRIDVRFKAAGEQLLFRPDGLVAGAVSGTPPRWELCIPEAADDADLSRRGRMVLVNRLGRPELARTADALAAEGFGC
jgi:type IV fimbrial biogenesis protein FimT